MPIGHVGVEVRVNMECPQSQKGTDAVPQHTKTPRPVMGATMSQLSIAWSYIT